MTVMMTTMIARRPAGRPSVAPIVTTFFWLLLTINSTLLHTSFGARGRPGAWGYDGNANRSGFDYVAQQQQQQRLSHTQIYTYTRASLPFFPSPFSLRQPSPFRISMGIHVGSQGFCFSLLFTKHLGTRDI